METISAKELDRYVQKDGFYIVDLRSPAEFARGHIRGAANVPSGRFRKELEGMKNRAIILYCERGGFSMAVARELEKEGYHTISVVGGIRAYRGTNIVRGQQERKRVPKPF
ncbi:MAG: rhodanese-like domain-containing protein [Candidatus Choladocola sp.]|nr:rhodanese-like domain-containing protein [Candidatus Choladocola sp.]